jgi:hypothetical protein
MSNENMNANNELAAREQAMLATQYEAPMGFEDEDAGDMIIPRIKVIQTLSPERKDKVADEGDIINSLTKERLNGKTFIPVFKFNNNIDWKDRSDGGGILCIARDGRIGEKSDGTQLMCASCKRCEFDNTKQGKEALPKCTKYINFFGFFAGERMPIILSFAKTNYNEGKKLYSLAKVTMQNMWNYGYVLNEKLMAKNGNEWYIVVTTPAGATSEDDRAFALEMYKSFRNTIQSMNFDMDDNGSESTSSASPDLDKTEF